MKFITTTLLLLSAVQQTKAFTFPNSHAFLTPSSSSSITTTTTSTTSTSTTNLFATKTTPVFDFASSDPATKQKSISSFERIDDAIMGGISLSALKDVPSQPYASWSGICRTDGGGFCGMRTLPFQDKPLLVKADNLDGNGVYLDVKLNSDDEPQRRMWKLTMRTDSSRGEMVYQAPFDLAAFATEASSKGEDWTRVKVPFETFQLVRGPRLIVDGPKLDLEGGIFQIGMTLSKFKIAVNTTVLEDFRAGYFELLIQQIGFYKDDEVEQDEVAEVVEVAEAGAETEAEAVGVAEALVQAVEQVVKSVEVPDTLSKKEAEKKRPLPLKILLPIAKILFSETANRRKSAMGILRNKRNMTRSQAIMFGMKSRAKSMGWIPSIGKTVGILSVDSARTIVKNFLKVLFLLPLRLVGKVVLMVKKALGMKVKPSLKE